MTSLSKNALLISGGSLNKTGVPSLMLEISKVLISQGWNCFVIYFSKSGNELLDYFIKSGVKPIFLNKKSKSTDIKKILKENNISAVHCFNEFDAVKYLKIAKANHIDIRIAHSNGVVHKSKHFLKNLYFSLIKNKILKNSTKLVGCSKEACISAFGNKKPYIVLPNLYDEETYKFHDLSMDSLPLSLIQVGSIQPNKNQFFTIKVFKEIYSHYPNAKLYIIGNTFYKEYFDMINNFVKQNQLENNVSFISSSANQIQYYDKSHYLIFPSIKEGFGTVLLEAQSLGLHCFASNSIPRSTDFGGVTYFDLYISPEDLSRLIIDKFEHNKCFRTKYNVSKHSKKNVAEIIEDIYE